MKLRVFISLLIIISLTACGNIALPNTEEDIIETTELPTENDNFVHAYVERVIDGDTAVVNIDGKEETVRFLLVNSPEKKSDALQGEPEPFAMDSTFFLQELIEGKNVALEIGVEERDNYGRLLAYVWVNDDTMAQELLLEEGLVKVAYVINDTTHLDLFKSVESKAKEQDKGIWSIKGYAEQGDKYNVSALSKTSNVDNSHNGECNIKGNINRKGDKIYHTVESNWYEETKPEEMFCSEQDAIDAGFRKAG